MIPNQKFLTCLVFAVISLTFISIKSNGQETFDIKISNIKKSSGKVVIDIYNNKSNWLKTPYKTQELQSVQDIQTVSFQVPYGKYAITIYQDMNSNKKTDMNFLGIPKEPVGFGNNYKPFGEPKFEKATIDFKANSKPHEIKLYEVF